MGIQVVGHTSFLGHTGYNNHSRNFFTHLNKYIPTRIRNYTGCSDLSYLKPEEYNLIIQQNLKGHPKPVGVPFTPNPSDTIVNLVLNESHHYYFYDKYDHPMIAYNVWESTKQLPEYFNRILEYDQFWCPTEWQKQCTIDQGYPADRVKVVHEGVNGNVFLPGVSSIEKHALYDKYDIPHDAFVFMIFGRWDYRKSTKEMVEAWYDAFGNKDKCYLVISSDNPFSSDGMNTTEERLKHYKCEHERIKILHFPERDEYVKWMQYGSCLLSCSRSEGWNLPLMEAIACGTPTICSDWGGHLEFADGLSYKVQILKELPPKQVYMLGDNHDLGVWGEPDFSHLKYVMQTVYNDYFDVKTRAMATSKYIRQLYTWDNAARQAEGHIKELIKNKYHDMKPSKKFDSSSDMELYQDQYVNGSVVVKGKRDCESRYEAMRSLFESYNRPFTILDIGANFGYYSIKAASEYDAISVMIENKEKETDRLLELCEMNHAKNQLIVLNDTMNLHKLQELGKCEHFDIVLALNVIHHFNEDVVEVCKAMTELGDHLILETPPVEDKGSCGQNNLKPIIDYFNELNGKELGKFTRHTSDTQSTMFLFDTPKSEVRWPYFDYEKLFDRKDIDVETLRNRGANIVDSNFDEKVMFSPRTKETTIWTPGINLRTYLSLGGVYPTAEHLLDKLESKDVKGGYEWDGSSHDVVVHNFILSGHDVYLIDYADPLIAKNPLSEDEQLQLVTKEIRKTYGLLPKIKINLGCGNDIRKGYINVDKYNNTGNVDYQWDLGKLEVDDGSVDEIYTSHVFEHIELNNVYSVLEEWERALCVGGKIVMRLPNLETEVKIWLDAPDDRKWFEVHRIFGSQSHEGNTHFNGHNPASLKWLIERFNFRVTELKTGNRGHGEEIQLTAEKLESKPLQPTKYNVHFVDGPFGEVLGDSKDKSFYTLDFLDPDNNSSVHQQTLRINCWTRPHRKYYTNWNVQIRRNGKLVLDHKFDLKGKNVLISFDSKSLGDNIAWIPQVEEFRKKHECNVWVSTFWNELFKTSYPDLKFIKPGRSVDNLYASYKVGCYEGDFNKNIIDWREVPLQKVCSDTLGLDYKEIVCNIGIQPGPRPIEEKYVAISEFSTMQSKFWNYSNGWQEIVNYLNEIGYKVMSISKEETKLENVIKMNDKPIEETITNIGNAEFFIGIGTGPSWLAWALKKPVVLVSGFSLPFGEFQTNVERVINTKVCHGCFNKSKHNFDRGDWNWCPNHKGTDRQFECTKTITPQMVKKAISNIINSYL